MKPVPDVVGPGLQVLFCGINPSIRSGETGFHFARPGNRFWPALHLAGFTPRVLRPDESAELPSYGVGVTNLVDRPTRAAADLGDDELRDGVAALAALAEEWQPRTVAILGIGAFRTAFARPKATIGRAARDRRRAPAVGAAEPERAERPLPGRGSRAAVRRSCASPPWAARCPATGRAPERPW